MSNALTTKFCNMQLKSPVILLSGCVGFGEEYTRINGFSNSAVGAICLKGTTLKPQLGHMPHRTIDTPTGMINAIGLQNPGADVVINKILPNLDKSETRFIINISATSIKNYAELTRRFDKTDIDGIEINISCPNIKKGGTIFGNDPDMSYRVVEACRKNTSKPLITKLSPNQTDIADNAKRCINAGTDALAVINTIASMAIDIKKRMPIISNNHGGLSGAAIKPIALLQVNQVYEVSKKFNIPIIGQGGIITSNDAIEFIIAGATTVGIGTALFYDPLVANKINKGISKYLKENKLANVSELVGTLKKHKVKQTYN